MANVPGPAKTSHGNLIVVSALVSGAVVAYDIHGSGASKSEGVKVLGAVALLWGLIFVLGEFSEGLGASVAVFVLLVFLVARKGVVDAIFTSFGGSTTTAGSNATGSSVIAPTTGG